MYCSLIRGSVCFSLSLLMLLAAGCSDDDPATPPLTGSGVVKIIVGESSIMPEPQFGYAFTSSLDGTVLDSATWTEPSVVELTIPTTLGEGFYITQVYDFFGPQFQLDTSHHLVDAENILELGRPGNSFDFEYAELQFQNIPPHNGYTLDSGNITVFGDRLFESTQVRMSHEPVDVLLTIKGITTQHSYQWVPGVEFGTVHQVDLANLEPMPQCIVPLPPSPHELRGRISGYKITPGEDLFLLYFLDEGTFGVPTPEEWHPRFLDSGFDGYQVTFNHHVATDPRKMVVTQTEGGLPGSLSFWDLGITIVDPSLDGCLVETSESAESLSLLWGQGGFGSTLWNIILTDYSRPVVLPELPEDLGSLFPDLDREEFVLVYVVAMKETSGLARDAVTPVVIRDRVVQFR